MPVRFPDLPQNIVVEGETLTLKTELHVTLVYIGKIMEKSNLIIPDFIQKVTADFCEFVKTTSIDVLQYRDEFRLVASGERKTVIRMCDVSNLDSFFDFINEKYGLRWELPPMHVTLYTLQPNVGISLADADDLEKLSRPITNPISA